MALTDHDTVDGLPEAVAAGETLGVEVIPGVEISAHFPGGTMHILGLFVDYHNGHLDERLAVLKQARIDRNPQIIAKLNALGIPITMARVEEISGGGQVGRPHIARALMESGYVTDLQEAFDKYLGWRKPAYVSKFRFPPDQALAMIREAKGVPVLAHPFTLGLGSAYALKNLVIELKGLGLAGLEVYLLRAHPGAGSPVPEAGPGAGPPGHRRLRLPRPQQAGNHPGVHALPGQAHLPPGGSPEGLAPPGISPGRVIFRPPWL